MFCIMTSHTIITMLQNLPGQVRLLWQSAIHAIVWAIWLVRNHRIFQDKDSDLVRASVAAWDSTVGFFRTQNNALNKSVYLSSFL